MPGLVYDAGALIAAERNDRRMWALHARALARGVLPRVPAGAVVETWRGSEQPSLSKLLEGCRIEPLDHANARRAGALLRAAVAGAVDATVVEAAARHAATVVTSDRSDISRLASAAGLRLTIIDV